MHELVFLNNRYYDPGLGVFLSVDPPVSKTGDPYLYANGNPATLADPSGLVPTMTCQDGGCNGKDRHLVPAPQIGANNVAIPPSAAVAQFDIPVGEGAGVTRFQFFIDDDRVCLSGTAPGLSGILCKRRDLNALDLWSGARKDHVHVEQQRTRFAAAGSSGGVAG